MLQTIVRYALPFTVFPPLNDGDGVVAGDAPNWCVPGWDAQRWGAVVFYLVLSKSKQHARHFIAS
ncbi:MAG TPA: hypothetical protein VFU95_05685 [Telluria sp.]|nr:hypothetical protein [Telluria sp.]